jgi:hypothetical protein
MANLKLQALKAHYQAERLKAIATLEVYMSNSVGIGEHPQIIDEMLTLIQRVADADDGLEVLSKIFTEEAPEQLNG